jgi:hypothetical protein
MKGSRILQPLDIRHLKFDRDGSFIVQCLEHRSGMLPGHAVRETEFHDVQLIVQAPSGERLAKCAFEDRDFGWLKEVAETQGRFIRIEIVDLA